MSKKTNLRLAWCSVEACRFAVENWHYSRAMPLGRSARIGAWEDGRFIGCIMFAMGGNNRIGDPFGMDTSDCCELVRVALTHHATPVSRLIAIALRMFKASAPTVRIVVSYADPVQGHHGGIYKAGGWVYLGKTSPSYEYRLNGKRLQKRAFTGSNFGRGRSSLPQGAVKVSTPGKHKYAMPMDAGARDMLARIARPYPRVDACSSSDYRGNRPVSIGADASPDQGEEGGQQPTTGLQR
jgi:hypothetical protein